MKQNRHRQQQSKKQDTKKSHPLLRWFGYIVFGLVYVCVSTSLWIFHGPFPALKNYLIDSIDATRHGYLLRPMSLYTLPESVIKAHALNNNLVGKTIPVKDIKREDFSNVNDNSITLHTVHGKTYTAYILIVSDPKRVKVGVTKYLHQRGETVEEMVKDAGAVGGINAGGFVDTNWQGTGANPQGVTMHDGQVIANTGSPTQPQAEIAITKTGQLIVGQYSLEQLRALDVSEAVGFGPPLIEQGKALNVAPGGYNPRTAIGQTADGSIILIVTSGRGALGVNDAGASYADVTNLMLKYHAVVAANLDGGSSSTMFYNNKLINRPVDILGQRNIATSILIMPDKSGGGGPFG